MITAAAMYVAPRLVHLSAVDAAIIVFYFALVLTIGFYLQRRANTGEDFFMAGREMTAWVAGLSFLSANLGALELMGWAGSAYQYGILATHWYWIGAIPAMLFLALVMMPFYYISRTHSVPGYLKLRFGESSRALSAISFAFMTVLMSGINMYSMALVMKVVLGWNINFSIWVSTVMEETQMLKLMSQPSTTFMTSAIEYILMPLISTVMNAKVTAESRRLGSP